MDLHDPQIYFSTLSNSRHNAIQNWHNMSWYQLRDLLKHQGHLRSSEKDVGLISPWKYKTTRDDYLPRKTDDNQLWTIDGKPVVGRYADNVIGTSMLFFDFDGALSIKTAKSIFAPYSHLGYTSFSHMALKKEGKDCFRVVVPLAQFITAEQLVARRKAIYASIPGLDQSCLSLARSFYIPSCEPERAHLAHMWDSDGDELFDVMEYQPDIYVPPLHAPVVDRPIDHQKIVDSLKRVFLGEEPEWFKVACAMQANGFTYDDFREVSIGHLMHEKTDKHCRDKWKSAERSVKRGVTPSVGYLINLCKKHNAWVPAASPRQNMKNLVRSAA